MLSSLAVDEPEEEHEVPATVTRAKAKRNAAGAGVCSVNFMASHITIALEPKRGLKGVLPNNF
jgi:hypothetical protein